METRIRLDARYAHSEEVVAREIEGEIIIVPLVSGIGDMEDDLFTLNETGRAVWDSLDGKKTLKDVVEGLAQEYEGQEQDIRDDVLGFVNELVKRRMLIECRDDK